MMQAPVLHNHQPQHQPAALGEELTLATESTTWLAPAWPPQPRLPEGWLHFAEPPLAPFELLRNLETAVSLLQTTQAGLEQLADHLAQLIQRFHDLWRRHAHENTPPKIYARILAQGLARIDQQVTACRFHGRGLLDGQCGLIGHGRGLTFVRGGPQTRSSPPEGYAVDIFRFPSRATLIGSVRLQECWLRAEDELFLCEGDRFIRFEPWHYPEPTVFLERLQHTLQQAGLELRVSLNGDRRLTVQHVRYGSQFKFKGSSRSTPLLSSRPGALVYSQPGSDIAGMLGSEPAFGIGGLLTGYLDNPRTAELSVLWSPRDLLADEDYRVFVVQNGLWIPGLPVESHRSTEEALVSVAPSVTAGAALPHRLTLPALLPQQAGSWMETTSGFHSLAEAHTQNWQGVRDSLLLLHAVLADVDDWQERCESWLQTYQQAALQQLTPAPVSIADEAGRGTDLPRMGLPSADQHRMTRVLRQALLRATRAAVCAFPVTSDVASHASHAERPSARHVEPSLSAEVSS